MVLPFIPIIAGLTPTILAIGSRTFKYANKNQFTRAGVTSTIFGIGYGASTNIGYNVANTAVTSGLRKKKGFNTSKNFDIQMPYGRSYYPRRRYSRYPARRRSYMPYRPRRTYRRSYRSYY